MKKSFVLALASLLGAVPVAFPSGGPLNQRTYECTDNALKGGKAYLIRVNLEEAYSSEMTGNAAAFDDRKKLNQMKTSVETCFESNALKGSKGKPKSDHRLICGSGKREKSGEADVIPNNAGFRVLVWLDEGNHAVKARLEQATKDGTFKNAFGDLSCK